MLFPGAIFFLHLLFILCNTDKNDRLGFQWDVTEGKDGWKADVADDQVCTSMMM
jgi:hypothetical protein